MLFNGTVSAAEDKECRKRWENDHEWWTGKDLAGSGSGLNEVTKKQFILWEWWKPREPWVRIFGNMVGTRTAEKFTDIPLHHSAPYHPHRTSNKWQDYNTF